MPRPRKFEEQEVLQRAMKLFWEKGYHGTSVQDLVLHLGINRASLYDTFGDKHQLFLRALTHYRAKGAGEVLELLKRDFPLRDKLNAMLQNAVRNTGAEPGQRGCFILNATCELAEQDPEVGTFTREHLEVMVKAMESAIREAQRKEEISSEIDPRALAFHIYNTYNGMMMLSRSGAKSEDLARVADLALESLNN